MNASASSVPHTAALGLPRGKVGEIRDVFFFDRLQRFRHRGIIPWPRAVLVLSQYLQEVILPLAGDAGNVRLPRKIGVVADIATMSVGEGSAALHAGGIDGLFRGWRRRKSGEEFCKRPEILIAHARHGLIHNIAPVHTLTVEVELYLHEGGLLAAKRWHLWSG